MSSIKSVKNKPLYFAWLRPVIGLFSIITGLMYGGAAFIGFLVHIQMKAAKSTTAENFKGHADFLVNQGLSQQEAEKQIANLLEFNIFCFDKLGVYFPLILAVISCVSLVLMWSGVGFFRKKNWSVSMGRLASVALIVVVALGFLGYHSTIAEIAEKRNEIEAVEEFRGHSWMVTIRYIFICSMCPIALIIAYRALINQQVKPIEGADEELNTLSEDETQKDSANTDKL